MPFSSEAITTHDVGVGTTAGRRQHKSRAAVVDRAERDHQIADLKGKWIGTSSLQNAGLQLIPLKHVTEEAGFGSAPEIAAGAMLFVPQPSIARCTHDTTGGYGDASRCRRTTI